MRRMRDANTNSVLRFTLTARGWVQAHLLLSRTRTGNNVSRSACTSSPDRGLAAPTVTTLIMRLEMKMEALGVCFG